MNSIDKLQLLGSKPTLIDDIQKKRLLSLLKLRTGKLPVEYLDALEYFAGDIDFDELICYKPLTPSPWTAKDGKDAIDQLFGLVSYDSNSIFDMLDRYQDRLPDNWIPIGASPGGNLICLSTASKNFGQIAFWDHESEGLPGVANPNQPMFFIENSFSKFIDLLEIDKSL